MYPTGKEALDWIVEVITSKPSKFIRLVSLVRDMDRRAAAGDTEAQKIVDVVRQFARMIDAASKTQ